MNENSLMKVAIIGSGNVAWHLSKALSHKVELFNLNPRTFEGMPSGIHKIDIALLCVKDDIIEKIAKELPRLNPEIIAHTSGSIPMSILSKYNPRYGVFYPLQTFTKHTDLIYSDIPFFLEASDQEGLEILQKLSYLVSEKVFFANSEQRKKLHLASVFACNFTNALVDISSDILMDTGIPYQALLPLLSQTIEKLTHISPAQAQTGPAIRDDQMVINSHLEMLEHYPIYKDIYSLLSDYIRNRRLKENHKNQI